MLVSKYCRSFSGLYSSSRYMKKKLSCCLSYNNSQPPENQQERLKNQLFRRWQQLGYRGALGVRHFEIQNSSYCCRNIGLVVAGSYCFVAWYITADGE